MLAYGERAVLRPLFEPEPLEVARPGALLTLAFFALDGTPTEAAAPGEVLRVRAPGAKRVALTRREQEVVVAEPLGTVASQREQVEFILRVPFDLEGGTYLVRATAEGEEAKGERELRVDPSRPLFRFIFTPPRPAPGERVEVRLEARTLLREARLRLPWGGETLLSPGVASQGEQGREGWVLTGAFVLPPSLSFGQVVALEGVALTPDGVELPFRAAVRLRAGP
ncbi:hypothetical protein [Thermus filiformis]|uniref:Macroglobulin domain-containing protein n=1 Tax=Thermus filiformis TaxID=276 RepID=A0A0D6XBW1_THEFI|nr:hypothetical protein [Thermus filiformis]KIX84816.1 hypothetical protein THFILI_00615 [Thermus filiformis]